MKFGLLYEMQRPHGDDFKIDYTALIDETLEQCILADEVGFDYLWFVEHHFLTSFSGSSAPEVIISSLARLTSRIRLGFGVVVLPHHHPVQVAERLAMVDHLSGGRVEFGIGRSSPYEQLGLGVDPRDTREIMEESMQIVPKIWRTEGKFSWKGKHFDIPEREILPKPKQDPHPPVWMACTQPSSYEMAARHGVGVLSFGSGAPAGMKQHVDNYRENIKSAKPVGSFVNNQWANFTLGHCGDNNAEAQKVGANAIKEFFGPNRPYTADRKDVYDRLLESWGGVPDHLQANFSRFQGGEQDLGGGGASRAMLGDLPPELLAERGVIVAGDPDGCIECVKRHEEIGVDQTLLIMQSDQIPHEKVKKSIKLFGEQVIPAFKS
ncbi:MAG: LLM class flavin-dependent oxidoreductase [Chloroflexi bacterium]|nr:LLM class flavin-dependent oxidoreductase [Chloroflexota bacterium]MCH9038459.1 LLM class flavin-dependent oxidoreductase [Chloroflexota bacterium]MCI0791196.1 LLM class flavin-dependent oxidoreductase [Chloroflexota bacterium]